MHCIMVDWSGDWATPRGLASQMRPWSEHCEWSGSSDAPWKLCSVRKRSANVAAATKRPVRTEINHTFWWRAKIPNNGHL